MLTLEDAKRHLRVDHDDDDASITALIEAAEDHFRSIGVDVDAAPLPPAIVHAARLAVAFWYEEREGWSAEAPLPAMPRAADRLLAPHREICL